MRNDDVSVKAAWANSEPADNEMIRMQWKVTNNSKSVVFIDGYRVVRNTAESLSGYFEERKHLDHSNEENQDYRSNRHINTILWPEESRAFVWAYVDRSYYGLTKRGRWAYFVKIRYRISNAKSYSYAVSNIAPISFRKSSSHLQSQTFYRRHKADIEEIVKRISLKKDQPEIATEFYDEAFDYRIAHLGIIDTFLIGGKYAIAVEFAKEATIQKMNQMEQYMDWISMSLNKIPIGIIIAEISTPIKRPVLPDGYSLIVAYSENERVKEIVLEIT